MFQNHPVHDRPVHSDGLVHNFIHKEVAQNPITRTQLLNSRVWQDLKEDRPEAVHNWPVHNRTVHKSVTKEVAWNETIRNWVVKNIVLGTPMGPHDRSSSLYPQAVE